MASTSVSEITRSRVAEAEGGSPTTAFSRFLDGYKGQLALALPKHMTADRMARLALTAFSRSENLQKAEPRSIAGSLMTAATMGLEPGVNGQGYLIPYFDKRKGMYICEFVPGWKGLVDLANRSGRCTVWTGAVFEGDVFDYALGDSPFVRHQPQDEDDPAKLTHVYAIGRVNGSSLPVIEVWTNRKVRKHRDKYNKVGQSHYSNRDWEMYARKVPLLQVLKYMPSSIELSNAIAVASAQQSGDHAVIDGDFVTFTDGRDDQPDPETGEVSAPPPKPRTPPKPSAAAAAAPVEFDVDAFEKSLVACADVEVLDVRADQIRDCPQEFQERLYDVYRARLAQLKQQA
jgi:recombination protein RecT